MDKILAHIFRIASNYYVVGPAQRVVIENDKSTHAAVVRWVVCCANIFRVRR
jgi:hypothetical protein